MAEHLVSSQTNLLALMIQTWLNRVLLVSVFPSCQHMQWKGMWAPGSFDNE
jgi:hypothetical protein